MYNKLKDCIIISKESILKSYPNLEEYYANVIKKLYGDLIQNSNFETYNTSRIIRDKKNDLRSLKNLKDKVGVYIFTNEDCEPVYIGRAGKGRKSEHSLKDRLQKQLNADLSNSTLAKNIKEIEGLLQNDKSILGTNDKKKLKELIKKYAPKIFVIPVGKLGENKARELAQNLEKILIAVLRPKYNR